MARIINVLLAASLAACTRVPVRNVYCDGSARWSCADPAFPACDVAAHVCVAAPPDMTAVVDLASGRDLARGDLAACHASADCPASAPICDGGRCRACAGSADDGACAQRSSSTPRCLATTGTCAACAMPGGQSSDCGAATPICASDGTCRACAAHDECTSRICNLDGSCVPPAGVAYADNRNGACSGAHAATPADPACDIASALAVQPIVRVIGSNTAYARLTLSSGSARIVGPGITASPTARISGDLANPALAISGATTLVTLDGIEISGGGTGQDGIFCSQPSLGPSLTLLRSAIHDIGGVALDITKCDVTLDRDTLGPNAVAGGIVLAGARYSMVNTFIDGNGASGPGVTFGTGSATLPGGFGFAHVTVAKNAGGGIVCNTATTITSSIVWGNVGSDTTGSCTLAASITTPAPDFVDATGPSWDFHLAGRTATNLACCIDQVASSPVDHDFDGRHRPQNGRWDIGAHEVP